MNTYQVMNTVSGLVLGTYAADTREDALDAYARDAGYAGYAALCAVVDDHGIKVVEAEV